MAITSPRYFVFVAAVIIVYFFCVPKKWQWVVLLCSGFVFYYFAGGLELFGYIAFTIMTVYLCALFIPRLKNNTAKKWLIASVIIGNFGILAFFKWYNALAGLGNNLLSYADASFSLPLYSLLLPLGISFYTFQAVGYLIDVYREDIAPERNLARFALFVSFFPQLVQGPISRHSDLAEQLYASRKFDYVQFRRGVQLMVWGLFKKMVVADRIVMMTNTIFGTPEKYKGLYILIGVIAWSVWLYSDFSGGIDIVRGVGQMLGITMPQNFKRPFFATSIPEYWRRWHLTIQNWWRDYLFYPFVLSKPIVKFSRLISKLNSKLGRIIGVYIGIFIVRTINAMWHTADPYYVVNGLYFGVLMVLGMVLAPIFAKMIKLLRINTECFSWRLFQRIRTYLILCLSLAFLATQSVTGGFTAIGSIVKDFNPWILNFDSMFLIGLSRWDVRILFIGLALMFIVDLLQEKGIAIREALEKQNIAFQWLLLLGGIVAVLLWGAYGPGYDPAAFRYQGI